MVEEDKIFYNHLVPFIGEKAALFIDVQTKGLVFHLKVTKARETKYGDYSSPIKNKKQRITINGNLDKYSFLLTLLHELAHLMVFENYDKKVKPHGKEWKYCFSQILLKAINDNIFPLSVNETINKYYINKQSFTHNSRVKISNAIDKELGIPESIRLENIPINKTVLLINGMTVTKLEQKRTRCICRNLEDRRLYYIHKFIEVESVIS